MVYWVRGLRATKIFGRPMLLPGQAANSIQTGQVSRRR